MENQAPFDEPLGVTRRGRHRRNIRTTRTDRARFLSVDSDLELSCKGAAGWGGACRELREKALIIIRIGELARSLRKSRRENPGGTTPGAVIENILTALDALYGEQRSPARDGRRGALISGSTIREEIMYSLLQALWVFLLTLSTLVFTPPRAGAQQRGMHFSREAQAAQIAPETKTAQFSPEAQAALGAYRGLVEEHISGVLHSLRLIAQSGEAKSRGWEGSKPLLMQLGKDLATDATAWYALPDGSYFATENDGMSEQNLKDRAYFPELMAGREVFGDLVISKSTGHRSVIIAVPVSQESKVVGAVGVSLRVRLLSELVDQHLRLPADHYFYALERDTRIALHRRADRMFKTPSDVGDEALGAEFKKVLLEEGGSFDYSLNGENIASIFERSPSLGWYFFLAKRV